MIDRRNTKDGHNKQQDGKHNKIRKKIREKTLKIYNGWMTDGRTDWKNDLTDDERRLTPMSMPMLMLWWHLHTYVVFAAKLHAFRMEEWGRWWETNCLMEKSLETFSQAYIHSYMQSCSQVNRCNCTQQNVTVNNMEKQETDKHADRHAESQDSSALNITRRRRIIKPKPVEKW